MIDFKQIIMSFDEDKDYTIQEIADAIGMSYSGVMEALKRGAFPSRKVFSRHYINGADIIKYLTKGK